MVTILDSIEVGELGFILWTGNILVCYLIETSVPILPKIDTDLIQTLNEASREYLTLIYLFFENELYFLWGKHSILWIENFINQL